MTDNTSRNKCFTCRSAGEYVVRRPLSTVMSDRIRNIPEWRKFEQMVARIEADARPLGLLIKSPDRIRSLVTGELREVDASVRATVDGSEVLITIECRQRSSKEDITWIEQLVTKKQALGAARTIAVSSSGFSEQAKVAAKHYGIDLRLLNQVTMTDINPNLRLDFVLFNHKRCAIAQVGIRRFYQSNWTIPKPEDIDFLLPEDINPMTNIFHNTDTGNQWSLNDLWHELQQACNPLSDIEKGTHPVVRTVCFPYLGNVTVDTPTGAEKIGDVLLSLVLWIEVEQVTFEDANKFSCHGAEETDLQRIEFHSEIRSNDEWSVALQMPRTSSDLNQLRTRLTSLDEPK